MYKPNPNCYGAMFAIPAIAADQYLAEASGDDLKVLLCIFRDPSGGISIDNLSAALKLSADKVLASLDFWVSRGVLLFTDEQGNTKFVPRAQRATAPEMPAQKPASPLPAAKPAVVHTLPMPEIPKPTMEQIAARLAEDDTVKSLFLEAQRILGRTFGLDVQSTLLALYDTYGLQKEVILTLLQHLTEKGRGSTANILKVGKIWAQHEIETLDDANEYIKNDAAATQLFRSLAAAVGIATPRPTPKQTEYILSWQGMGFSADMLIKAYEEMAERTGKVSFAYMDKILKNWYANNLKTPNAVDESYKAASAARKSAGDRGTSYNLDEALQKATLSAKKLAERKNTEQ